MKPDRPLPNRPPTDKSYIPTTQKEVADLGWEQLDVILLTGDSYIDSPFIGSALIGKVLMARGYRVGIIAQPDMESPDDIKRLGEPALFWGVTSGSVDSMVANYTATKKWRKTDDYTPGGINNKRPDRAVIAYSNLIRRYFKNTSPIVLGGIEASLRRVSHYDYWSNKVRKSILFDAKADFLIYGMGERAVTALARSLKDGTSPLSIPGICHISKTKPSGFLELPSFEETRNDPHKFMDGFELFYTNNDPITAVGLVQQHDARYLVQNPPSDHLSTPELDDIYALHFERELHPYYRQSGEVRALDTIRFSIPTHRGCYGECSFCAIAVHEGRRVSFRSEQSILNEAKQIAAHPDFKGIISDAGGPTANMYGYECSKKIKTGACTDKRCLFPSVCKQLKPDHKPQIALLSKLRKIKGVKKVFVASGIRYDLLLEDKKYGMAYLSDVAEHHVSGQMKVAPEHTEPAVLNLMGKPDSSKLLDFKRAFDRLSKAASKNQFLTYYLIAGHPGCSMDDMKKLYKFTTTKLKIKPEQVQVFTPTPSTMSTMMYHTGMDPLTRKKIFVEKNIKERERQKKVITGFQDNKSHSKFKKKTNAYGKRRS